MFMIANSIDVSNVPEEIKILPLGSVESQKGRFLVDEESTKLIINGFMKRKLDLVIDYEHQTLEGTQAPAAGWIHDLYKADDSIMAKVEWTNKAKEYLSNKEYRYLSPVVMVTNSGVRAVALHSVALTNTPAIDGMFPIINSLQPSETKTNKPETDQLVEVCRLLGIGESEGLDKIIEKIKELFQANESTKTELERMKYELAMNGVNEAVEQALHNGKITPAMRSEAMKLAQSDLQAFKNFVSHSPIITPPLGKLDLTDAPHTVRHDQTIANLLGLSDNDIQRFGQT